jgi:hypothetical protein
MTRLSLLSSVLPYIPFARPSTPWLAIAESGMGIEIEDVLAAMHMKRLFR